MESSYLIQEMAPLHIGTRATSHPGLDAACSRVGAWKVLISHGKQFCCTNADQVSALKCNPWRMQAPDEKRYEWDSTEYPEGSKTCCHSGSGSYSESYPTEKPFGTESSQAISQRRNSRTGACRAYCLLIKLVAQPGLARTSCRHHGRLLPNHRRPSSARTRLG